MQTLKSLWHRYLFLKLSLHHLNAELLSAIGWLTLLPTDTRLTWRTIMTAYSVTLCFSSFPAISHLAASLSGPPWAF